MASTRHGDEVCLITGPGFGPEGTLEQRAKQREIDIRVLPELQRNLSPLKDVRAYAAIKREFPSDKPDLVHTHSLVRKQEFWGGEQIMLREFRASIRSTVRHFTSVNRPYCIIPIESRRSWPMVGASTSLLFATR